MHRAANVMPEEISGVESFAVGVNDTGSRFLVSMSAGDADGVYALTPEQASRLAGMLLAALAKTGREPSSPGQPTKLN